MPSIFKIFGEAQFRGDATGSGNALTIADSSGNTRFTIANTGRLTLGQDTGSTISTAAVITTNVAGAALVLRPNGAGAIIAAIPDNSTSGGNARGANAVDLQTAGRGNANMVASGFASFVAAGQNNRAAGFTSIAMGNGNSATQDLTFAIGGGGNTAGANRCGVIGGENNSNSGTFATIIGGENNEIVSGASYSFANGVSTITYLYGQFTRASGAFSWRGDAQYSKFIMRRSITGISPAELFLNGTSNTAFIYYSGNYPNVRAWCVNVQLVATVQTAGGAGLTVNEVFAGQYQCAIKRVSNGNAAMVGTVTPISTQADTNMVSSVVTIDANGSTLRIQFTPPTTADANTVIRVVASVDITEVAR